MGAARGDPPSRRGTRTEDAREVLDIRLEYRVRATRRVDTLVMPLEPLGRAGVMALPPLNLDDRDFESLSARSAASDRAHLPGVDRICLLAIREWCSSSSSRI